MRTRGSRSGPVAMRSHGQRRSARLDPGFLEDDGHLPGGRALDAAVRVAKEVLAGQKRRAVLVADVHASRERDAPVGDQDLAVVAPKQKVQRAQPDRAEEARLDAALRHLLPEAPPRLERSDPVGQDAHGHAAARGRDQARLEAAARRVVLEDVRLQQHLLARRLDGLEHGVEGVGAVEEDIHAPGAEKDVLVDPREQLAESRSPVRRSGTPPRSGRRAPRPAPAGGAGPATDGGGERGAGACARFSGGKVARPAASAILRPWRGGAHGGFRPPATGLHGGARHAESTRLFQRLGA